MKNEKVTFKKVKNKLKHIDRTNTKVLIFHAASAGEYEQIKPILNKIDKSKYFIIQTFSSPTIYNSIKDNELFDVCCYHPYDIWWGSYMFFNSIKPDAYIITRHDIWPMHLFIAYRLNIKTFYINANIHKNSIWIKPFIHNFSKTIFSYFTLVCVPSEMIKDKIKTIISEEKVIITGDSRFEQVINRYTKNSENKYLHDNFLDSNNIIFGSYDQYDEKIILNSIDYCFPNGDKDLEEKNSRLIFVPHEIDYQGIKQLQNNLKGRGISSSLYTENNNNDKISNVLIVDTVGILADIYKYANLAYIGSGFGAGVHSVIEPGIYGCIVSFGPNIDLLDEAIYIYQNNLGYMINDKIDMCRFMKNNYSDSLEESKGNALKEYILSHKNISKTVLNHIESCI